MLPEITNKILAGIAAAIVGVYGIIYFIYFKWQKN